MCVLSMVHDHFGPKIPDAGVTGWYPPQGTITVGPHPSVVNPTMPSGAFDLAGQVLELRKLIADFREAVAAAKKVDALTGQPDCVDPEKAKLEARVAALEAKLKDLPAY